MVVAERCWERGRGCPRVQGRKTPLPLASTFSSRVTLLSSSSSSELILPGEVGVQAAGLSQGAAQPSSGRSVRSETCLVTNQAQQAPGRCRRVSSDLFGGEEVTRAPGRGSSRYTLTLHRRLFTLSEMFYSKDQVLEMGEDILAPCSPLAPPCCNRGALQALGRAQGRLLLNR